MEYEELKSYLRDVYEVEKQLYSLREIANMYKKEIDILNKECNTIYMKEPLLEHKSISNYQFLDDQSRRKEALMPPGNLYGLKEPWKYVIFEHHFPTRRARGWNLYEDEKRLVKPYLKRRLLPPFELYYPPAILKQGSEFCNSIIKCYKEYYDKDLKEKRNHFRPIYEQRTKEYNELILETLSSYERLLEEIYAKDIIHPKYRNFLAVAQIYEYFDTGRCTELGGPNGAYNLYEQELRQNIIIDKLSMIISQLQVLNRTMAYVASAINENNSILRNISSTLRSIDANTALTAYNSQCIANSTNIANRYNY